MKKMQQHGNNKALQSGLEFFYDCQKRVVAEQLGVVIAVFKSNQRLGEVNESSAVR